MTTEEREDLYVEWEITPTKNKAFIKEQYEQQFKGKMPQEHWEEYLVEALNLKRVWGRKSAS